MKWTTANVINPNYGENHEIYVGTATGSFKKLQVNQENPFAQRNLQDVSALNKESKVTCLDFGNDDKTEILIGRANKFAQVYSARTESICSNVKMLDTPIVGLARYDTHLIAGFGTGQIQKLQDPEPLILTAGDNISRMRQCPVNRKLVATGGKERQNNLKVFDMYSGKQVFTSKNLPNDFLQLEVPVWDSDIGFIDANTLATCSRYGYVRVYDIRKQRRPVQKFAYEKNDNQMSFTTLFARDNFIYTGTTMGALKAFDIRNLKNFVHTYKGFTGSVSDLYLDDSGKYLLSGCLDRYVRVHHAESCVLMYQCYVKSKATRVLLKSGDGSAKKEILDDDEEDCVLIGEEDEGADNDKEYDDIFDNMQTVCEQDSDDEEEEVKSEKKKIKRKSSLKSGKAKKKKA